MKISDLEAFNAKASQSAKTKTVYVIGAGFSAGLGYPLTSNLLINAWSRLKKTEREDLKKVIQFHYPYFDPKKKTSFPYIEQLLTKMKVNRDMFEMSRPAAGNFTKNKLQGVEETLLYSIAAWFHELYGEITHANWLSSFINRLNEENATVISFNWDLVLDHRLFPNGITQDAYGLGNTQSSPILLKPHGSLNWYDSSKIKKVKEEKRIPIFQKGNANNHVEAFSLARDIKSGNGNKYMPLIVAPSYLKDFNRSIFQEIWQQCTDALSTASHIYFLGYSLPPDDLQAQFILRCGFYNQLNGRLKDGGGRHNPTGAAKVTIVNPDQTAARRIEAVAGSDIVCKWLPQNVESWIDDQELL